MKKILLKTMLLLCALVVGSSVWAVDVTYKLTIDTSNFTTVSYANNNNEKTSYAVCTTDNSKTYEVKWTSNQVMQSNSNMQWQKNNGYIYNSTDLGTITAVTVTSSAGSFTTYYGTSEQPSSGSSGTGKGFFKTSVGNATGTTSMVEITFTISEGGGSNLTTSDLALTDAPVALEFDLKTASSQTVSYTTSSTGNISVSGGEDYVTTSVNGNTITVTPVAVTPSPQTITVAQEPDDTYDAGTKTFTVSVIDSRYTVSDLTFTKACGGSGTADDGAEWTVASDANESTFTSDGIHYGTGSANVTYLQLTTSDIDGQVSKVVVNARDAQEKATISVTVGGVAFTCTGSTTVTNTSTDYTFTGTGSGEIIVRIDRGSSMLKAIYVKSVKVTYQAVAVKAPTINVASEFVGSTTATITCETEGAAIYYSYDNSTWMEYTTALNIIETTTIYAKAIKDEDESTVVSKTTTKTQPTPTVTIDATGITNTDLYSGTAAGSLAATVTYSDAPIGGATVTWSGNNDAVATINEETGAVTLVGVGSVTFTAIYAGNSDYAGTTATYELTVVNNNPNIIVTLWSEDFGSYSSGDVPSEGTYNYTCEGSGTKIYEQYLAGGSSPELLVAGSSGTFTATIPLNNISGDLSLKFKINPHEITVSTTTAGISGSGTFSSSGEHVVTFKDVTSDMTSITIQFAAGSSNVRLDEIVLTGTKATTTTTVTSAGYSTYVTPFDIDFTKTDDLTAYVATNTSGDKVRLESVDNAPKGTPLVLKGDAGTYTLVAATTTDDIKTNLLTVSNTEITAGVDNIYVLANINNKVGFYALDNGVKLPAGRVYLDASGAGVKFLNFSFDENEADGIEAIEKTRIGEGCVYDLQGRRLSVQGVLPKGVYIVNGKKVMVK